MDNHQYEKLHQTFHRYMDCSGNSLGDWEDGLRLGCSASYPDDLCGLSEAHIKRPYVKGRRYSPRTIRNQCVGVRVPRDEESSISSPKFYCPIPSSRLWQSSIFISHSKIKLPTIAYDM